MQKPQISRTKIKKSLNRKTSPLIQETISIALKNKNWNFLAKILSSSTRKYSSINLFEIDKQTSIGDTVLIPGKILSSGDLTKKVRISALYISDSAKDKLKKTKSEFVSISDEIKSNPKAEGVKIIR